MKIWAKLITDGKIRKQFVYEKEERLTYSHFFDYLTEICQALDIPTPVLLKTHIFNFAKFNHVRFIRRDFVEEFDYDQLFLENIILYHPTPPFRTRFTRVFFLFAGSFSVFIHPPQTVCPCRPPPFGLLYFL